MTAGTLIFRGVKGTLSLNTSIFPVHAPRRGLWRMQLATEPPSI